MAFYDTGRWNSLFRMLGLACIAACAALAGCAGSGSTPPGTDPAAHYHFLAAPGDQVNPHPWVVLLPGSSGLKIFEDERHYFRAAESLNAAGFDALIVDYKPAYKASKGAPDGPTGAKIAWVTGQAIDWAKAQGHFDGNAPGAIIAWSLGGEGLWRMLADPGLLDREHIRAAAAYYPSNQDNHTLHAHIPLVILTGEADDVVELSEVKALVAKRDKSAEGEVLLKSYPGAHHGFDISSLTKKRTMELIPLIGPRATFAYNAEAASGAHRVLLDFLSKHVR